MTKTLNSKVQKGLATSKLITKTSSTYETLKWALTSDQDPKLKGAKEIGYELFYKWNIMKQGEFSMRYLNAFIQAF